MLRVLAVALGLLLCGPIQATAQQKAAPAAPLLTSAVAAAPANAATLAPGMLLSWSVDASNSITFKFSFDKQPLNGPNYVAIGLSETGGMKGADIWVLSRDQGGKWQLVDYHATGFVRPVKDASQDVKLLEAQQAPNGSVSATLRRPLVTCDASDDLQIRRGAPIYVIWAFGKGQLSYHGSNRGYQLLELAPEQQPPPAAAAAAAPKRAAAAGPTPAQPAAPAPAAGRRLLAWDAKGPAGAKPGADAAIAAAASRAAAASGGKVEVVNVTMPRLIIPSNQTTSYLVKYFQLPNDGKHWILRYGPLFNAPLVHHAVVYGCGPSSVPKLKSFLSTSGPGPHDEMQIEMQCHSILMLAAPNVKPYVMPEGSGLPVEKGDGAWIALEVHYNNPDLLEGQVDPGSGVWVEVTSSPQKYDVGLLTLSQYALQIPPGRASFDAPTAVCPSECTKKFVRPVTLLDQGYHMHGIGKSAKTRRFRNGRELSPLNELHAYDYGYQSFTPVPQDARILMPGDRLEFTCTFDSRERVNQTNFGLGTNDEMCFHWIMYVPAQRDMGLCSSIADNPLASCSSDYTASEILGASMQEDPEVKSKAKPKVDDLVKKRELVAFSFNATKGAAPYVAPQCTKA